MMTLEEIYNKHFDGTWPDMNTSHSYLEFYSELLAPYRNSAKNILEVGLFTGARLKIWEEYFSGNVYGIDCDEQPHGGMADLRPMIEEGIHNIHIFDATDRAEIKKRFDGVKFDIIFEDAGHDLSQQLDLYKAWKPYLSENALYIIEDVQEIMISRGAFEKIDPSKRIEIIDRRAVKNRYDDILIIIR